MVIKPWGFALWENIRARLDVMFKETGHVNAYFPLFIPLSHLKKEAEHVEGFAKECAVVTHHRLEAGNDGDLLPAGKLEEPLVVRPTSETIIGATYAKWIQSYRDLPILINQWANVVRWEMRPRIFLRTSEFLWQEGHTAHETSEEAWQETMTIMEIYRKFAEEYLAIPVIAGEKTPGERFPGAVNTFSIEAMMQDRKAIQAGTSHFLGQNFAKSSGITFQTRDGKQEHAWTTSWGVSTRLIGGIIMTHGDDDGIILPPRVAPKHIAILPVIKNDSDSARVLNHCESLASELRLQKYLDKPVEVIVDRRDVNAGEKGWNWTKKGIPIKMEIGPRDMESDSVCMYRRDSETRQKQFVPRKEAVSNIANTLDEIQNNLFKRALDYRSRNTVNIDKMDEFKSFFTLANPDKPEIHGGFAMSHWCGSAECETGITDNTGVTIRCVPLNTESNETGSCILCGKQSSRRVVFAKAY